MTKRLNDIDYTSRDFESIRADLISTIQIFTPEWTDHNESDMGMVLLDLFAAISDKIHYYIDDRANEGFLPTAKQYENVINLLKLIDYIPKQPIPSSTLVTYTLSEPIENDIIIPKDHRLTTSNIDDTYTFHSVENILLPAGETTITGTYKEGVFFDEEIGISDGTSYQEFKLNYNNWAEGSLEIYTKDLDDNIVNYTYSDALILEDSSSKTYSLRKTNDETFIVFGDGINGYIPNINFTVNANYFICKGSKGNIGSNLLTTLVDPIIDVLGNAVNISCNNLDIISGGNDRESIEHAKVYGPKTLKTLDRAVTLEDYNTLSSNYNNEDYGSIAKATSVPDYTYFSNRVIVYVLGKDSNNFPTQVNTELKNSLKNYLETKKMATTDIVISDAILKPINITANIFAFSNYVNLTIKTNVTTAIENIFKIQDDSGPEFGKIRSKFPLSDIYAIIEAIQGVDYVDIILPSSNVSIGDNEFPTLGTITLNVTGGI